MFLSCHSPLQLFIITMPYHISSCCSMRRQSLSNRSLLHYLRNKCTEAELHNWFLERYEKCVNNVFLLALEAENMRLAYNYA